MKGRDHYYTIAVSISVNQKYYVTLRNFSFCNFNFNFILKITETLCIKISDT